MSGLKVPFALDETRVLVDPSQAEKGRVYLCPGCGDPVIFKKGAVKVPHFSHRAGTGCTQESIIHKTAKRLVQQMVTNWRSGYGPVPKVLRQCENWVHKFSQPLPDKVTSAELEYRLPGGRVVDVALMSGSQPVAGVEIRVSHAVDEIKAADIPIPFIELKGIDILAKPDLWVPIVDQFRATKCPVCAEQFEQFKKVTSRIAKENGITLPTEFFRYSVHDCYRCRKPMISYWWPGKVPPKKVGNTVRPSAIQFQKTRFNPFGIWLNTCPNCQAPQSSDCFGNSTSSPFYCLGDNPDALVSFEEDLKWIANWISSEHFTP